ncbi:glycosyltransferase [Winogradskyella sp. PG-2]|uniref:glycosyltransferase n=1 Tax=Winogradskyella sp. PG-2 TaxID=754409 RepID=UPI0004585F6A|nr:glycosyltransferase [Winogradskyella sp. PG-2]BAO75191.1 glycosyl transferase, group 1 [Winogradskyella sp. PG-2]
MKYKRLLIITPIYARNQKDDTTVPFIKQFLDFFSQTYPEVNLEIVSMRYPFDKDQYHFKNITVHHLGGGFKKRINTIKLLFKTFFMAKKLHKNNTFDGVLSFWYGEAMLIGRLLKFFFNLPHFTWLQGQDVKYNNRFMRWFAPNPNHIIASGDLHNAILQKEHKFKASHIAPISLNTKDFPPLNTFVRKIDILGVGNLGPIKNYNRFIKLIDKIKHFFPKIKAVIHGEGELKIELEKQIIELGLADNITLTGMYSNSEVRKSMNNTKVFLHTSIFESGPLVIHEALYSGCKVISTIAVSPIQPKKFCFSQNDDELVQFLIDALYDNDILQRVLVNNISDTAKTIYNCFFSSRS